MHTLLKNTYFKSALTTACISILMALFGYFYITQLSTALKGETKQYLSEMSIQGASSIKSQINNDLQLLQTIANFITQDQTFDIEETMVKLISANNENTFKRMGIILPDGAAHTTDGEVYDFSERPYFLTALEGTPNLSDTFSDVVDGQNINVYAAPIFYKDSTAVQAVLFATIGTDVYKNILSITTFNGQGYSYVIKSDGNVVIRSGYSQALSLTNIFSDITFDDPQNLSQLQYDLKNGGSNLASYTLNDQTYYMSYAPIGINDWFILSVTPKDVVATKTNAIMNATFLTWLVIVLVFSLLLTYILLNKRQQHKKLEQWAFCDPLTGGANWNKLQVEVERLLIENPQTKYCFVAFDIDTFKVINDLYGFDHGNKLISYMAEILSESITQKECFAHYYADHFYIFLAYQSDQDIITRIEELILKLSKFDAHYHVAPSFGIYKLSEPQCTPADMSDRATLAKKTIKGSHEMSYAFYNAAMRNVIIEEKAIENEMIQALENKEFVVYYQPKYHLIGESLGGAEALVRWNHPQKGLIPPNNFIPLFERNGFIVRLDLYVFERVCAFQRENLNSGYAMYPISFNLSKVHLYDLSFIGKLETIASTYQIPPCLVEVELTESVFMDNAEILQQVIVQLHAIGFTVSIDDFGSGYSSLSLLKTIPVDVIKLDRGFFNDFSDLDRAQIVVASMINMSHNLQIKTIAEGVETLEQVSFLKTLHCHMVQGYYFARPMPEDAYRALLTNDIDQK